MVGIVKSWDTLSIVLVTLAGLVLGILELVPKIRDYIPADSVVLILLGVIGTHFAIERFATISRLEHKLDLVHDVALLADFEPRQRNIHARATRDFVELQRTIGRLTTDDEFFRPLSVELLESPALLLNRLALGRLIVPPYQVVAAQQQLGRVFTSRFDAVSEKDIDFWDESVESEEYFIAAGYFRQNSDAIKRGTIVTRIFVVTLRDLNEKIDRLVRVLERQQRAGIGWAVVVFEELEDEVRRTGGRLDFAIFNSGQAVSYFRREYPRRFETVFRIRSHASNEREIRLQLRLHQLLIAECWLVNDKFLLTYAGAHPVDALEEIYALLDRHNAHLDRILGEPANREDDHFVFVVKDAIETRDKLNLLRELVAKYRVRRGADPPVPEHTSESMPEAAPPNSA